MDPVITMAAVVTLVTVVIMVAMDADGDDDWNM